MLMSALKSRTFSADPFLPNLAQCHPIFLCTHGITGSSIICNHALLYLAAMHHGFSFTVLCEHVLIIPRSSEHYYLQYMSICSLLITTNNVTQLQMITHIQISTGAKLSCSCIKHSTLSTLRASLQENRIQKIQCHRHYYIKHTVNKYHGLLTYLLLFHSNMNKTVGKKKKSSLQSTLNIIAEPHKIKTLPGQSVSLLKVPILIIYSCKMNVQLEPIKFKQLMQLI